MCMCVLVRACMQIDEDIGKGIANINTSLIPRNVLITLDWCILLFNYILLESYLVSSGYTNCN